MAYETGVASSPADLLSKLATFAAANGWTVNVPASGTVFINGSIYVGASSDATRLLFRGALGYSAGASWDAQINAATWNAVCSLSEGPFTAYHFFSGSEGAAAYLHGVIEIVAGRWAQFSFGSLVKAGAYTGGTYVDALRWSTLGGQIDSPDSNAHNAICDAQTNTTNSTTGFQVWADFDSKVNNWVRGSNAGDFSTTRGIGSVRSGGIVMPLFATGAIAHTLRTPFLPMLYFANRPDNLRSVLGRIPDARFLTIDSISDGELITVGTDDWLVFPMAKRGITSADYSSSNRGYAFKRVM